MSHRYTVEVLRSGQPRAYADTEQVVRLTFEHVPWNSKDGKFEPRHIMEDWVREYATHLKCGFCPTLRKDRGSPFDTYLDYLRPIDPKTADQLIQGGDPKQTLGSIWEFRTVTPYTD